MNFDTLSIFRAEIKEKLDCSNFEPSQNHMHMPSCDMTSFDVFLSHLKIPPVVGAWFVKDLNASIYWYASISISDTYIILGGTNNGVDSLNSITKYENDDWSLVGTLSHPRKQHSAIFNGREVMIIGGGCSSETEIWDTKFLTQRSLVLKPKTSFNNRNFLNPVLFMVPYNFK